MDRVAIVGIGQTKHAACRKEVSYAELVYEAVTLALKDAGIGISEIDNIVTTSNDFWDGRTISCMATGDVSGGYDKNISCVEGDGTFGAFYGLTRILSGSYGTTLVTAYSKGSESVSSLITNAAFDPIYMRCLGLDMVSACALQARRYLSRYGISEEDCALVSVKNHGNALDNPNAQLGMKLTVKDVMNSRMIASPLKLYDISPISDGACAIVLAREDRARKITDKPVWVKGVSFCADAYLLGDRDLSECRALEKAAGAAYKMAGIRNLKKEIDLAEIYDAFSYQELLWTEGLGFCEKGEGGKLIADGATAKDGDIPVNPSGGLLGAHPVIAAGLIRIAEAALQIRGDAGAMQIKKDVRNALAHGVNGVCGQSHCVWILGQN
ncbi:MAG: thiolase family protein [Deltaproteobacteria bacterium]|nr:MAG: thiolase family protein [Deltaproteobacteria bacterium]